MRIGPLIVWWSVCPVIKLAQVGKAITAAVCFGGDEIVVVELFPLDGDGVQTVAAE